MPVPSPTTPTPPAHAMILAGGLGTRLQGLLDGRNKPLMPVAGRPFLEFLLLQLRGNGLRNITMCTGFRGDLVRTTFGDGAGLDVSLQYSQETTPLGTAGAIRLALEQSTAETVVVLNGDSFLDVDIRALVASHVRTGAILTLALIHVPDSGRYGAVEIARDGRVLAFREKDPTVGAGFINAGVYVFSREILSYMPASLPSSLERDVFPQLLDGQACGVPTSGFFVDIGLPATYLDLNANPGPLFGAIPAGDIRTC